MTILLSTAYLPNLQYLSKFARSASGSGAEPVIESLENFQKQTYRNRAHVMTAEGVAPLVVPILWDHGEKMPIRQVRIDNRTPWQRTHWRTLTAAYAASPFFDHFAERFMPYFQKKYDLLWELNCDLTAELLRAFGLDSTLKFTESYTPPHQIPATTSDFRDCISHKPRLSRPDPDFSAPVYYQVFSDRQPFAENLSALDYLFCEGPKLPW